MFLNSIETHRPVIAFKEVGLSYGTTEANAKRVLSNVSFAIEDGEFVIIYGPSGSGKSSILNLIAGLEMPSEGKVLIHGRNLSHLSPDELAKYHRQKMGMVFQNFNLVKSLNVWENVALPQTASGVRYNLRKKRAEHLLNLLDILETKDRHPSELSGGQQQRVAIARALINNPLLLLVDEPTGNLDSKTADEVMRILHGLHYKAHHTIVLVTHNPNHLNYANRIIYIQDGQVAKEEVNKTTTKTVDAALPEANYQELQQFKGVL